MKFLTATAHNIHHTLAEDKCQLEPIIEAIFILYEKNYVIGVEALQTTLNTETVRIGMSIENAKSLRDAIDAWIVDATNENAVVAKLKETK